MPQLAPTSPAPLSLDTYLAALNSHDLVVFVVTGKMDHPLIKAGDVLIIDTQAPCRPDDWMLFQSHNHFLLEKQQDLTTLIRRSRLFLAGADHNRSLRIVGKVIAWIASPVATTLWL